MTAKERVLAAFEHRQPDRVPRFWNAFWDEFVVAWHGRFPGVDPMRHFGNDMAIVAADESPWPSRARMLSDGAAERLARNGWGQVQRIRADAHFAILVDVALPERVDPDTLTFDDPLAASRYEGRFDAASPRETFTLCKAGGPYQRTSFLRGEEQLWVDVMDDPDWVRALVDRVSEHLIAVGVQSLRRWKLAETGIAIFDDAAVNWGPFVGPSTYERLFLPALRRMVRAYREAGARFVMHHADGNVAPLLDMWIDAGIDAIHPVEYRSGMDAVKLRAHYGDRLTLVGGLDNSAILPRGDRAEVRDHVLHLLEAARGGGGGYILGPHSIGPDISVDTMLYVLELLEAHGAATQ